MRRILFILLMAVCMASCSRYTLPPFGTAGQWRLLEGAVANRDMTVNFGGDGLLANASDGSYDVNFITSQTGFNAYDTKCAQYLSDVIRHIPLKVNSIDVILADEYLILSTAVDNSWEPDYVRRADGVVLTVEANPVESLVQPHDEMWRNLIVNKPKRQIIVVDRLIKNGKHYAIVYVLQSDGKSSTYTRNIHYDISNPRNIQSIGTLLEGLMETSVNALHSNGIIGD